MPLIDFSVYVTQGADEVAVVPLVELIAGGAARWPDIHDRIIPSDETVYNTYCDRCCCDHGASGQIEFYP
jgi:hypothetical protein